MTNNSKLEIQNIIEKILQKHNIDMTDIMDSRKVVNYENRVTLWEIKLY